MISFGKRLGDQLKLRGLNQVDGARLLGLSQGALSRYLSGQTEPVITTAAEIAARLGLQLADLTCETTCAPMAVREQPAGYGRAHPLLPVFADLKLRWKRTKKHRELELAIRVMFPADAEAVLDWLNQP